MALCFKRKENHFLWSISKCAWCKLELPMSDLKELRHQLERLEAKWNDDSVSSPNELAAINKQRRELRKQIQALT